MALDFRAVREIKTPEMYQEAFQHDPERDALLQAQTEDTLAQAQERRRATAAASDQAREKQMRDAAIKQAIASSPTPFDAAQRLDSLDPQAATQYRGQLADQTARLLQGVSSYQAWPSVRPVLEKYIGPQAPESMPAQFASQADFDAWKRSQLLAHADLKTYLAETKPSATQDKTREITVTNPDGSTTIKIVKDEPGQEFQSAPKSVAVAQGFTLSPGQVRYGADGKPIASAPKTAGGATGPKPRSVTSGDANRIAELNNSIRDLDALAGAVQDVKGATGPAAAVGAALPNFVTSMTGWGTEAKEKQAVIDRVKQVIGKALEGGVLRKEDEDKYKKILPVISDPPAVVASKLEGLRAAIDRKRDETLSALEDAGYDTTRFRARAGGPTKDGQTVGRFTVEVE